MLLRSEEPGCRVVPRTIYFRYLKRIAANLPGVVSTATEPLPNIDYLDDGPTSPTTDSGAPPPADSWWSRSPDGVRLAVRVTPGAKRTHVTGIRDGALHVKLAARPVDGAANRALIDHLRRLLDVSKRSATIEQGEKSRHKTVLISEARGPVDPRLLLPSPSEWSRPPL